MVKINLLPHREEKRKQRKAGFVAMLGAAALVGGLIVLAVGGIIAAQIAGQNERNEFIKAENAKLDVQIKEIATLRQEIEALKARQQAVEDLQSDRNQPVYMMDELVKQVPEGVYLKSFKQEGQRVVLNGYAQSNERVSELLRNLGNSSPWLQKPDLIEIRSTGIGQGRDAKRVFDFTVNVGIKRPRDQEQQQQAASAAGTAAAPAAPKAP
ncbi:PilN domain-containing protein [Noviherbaspirillum sedimenti]|uniref:Fimbrial assembly protein n=1 Tax=Noviherbaspirillum sedimenti TaxID=2320865 RepID=A0A3A3GJ75_9BURK|nr:PilN domain-containing protein [Noviherbaspirillum sedimenti]RJG02346.1 fimbrial assembly protein [Noviherbaspirillum sedimenti]